MAGITEWIIISVLAVVLLVIYIRPHLKKEPNRTAETATTEKPSDIFSPDNYPNIKNFAIVIAIIATIVVATLTLSKFLNIDVWKNEWYQIIVGATAIICLIGWVQKKIQIESADTICKIVLAISILMLILNTVWPWTTLDGLREKFKTAKKIEVKIQLTLKTVPFKDFNLTKTEKFIGIINPGERFQYISPVWFYLKTETGEKVPYMPSRNHGEIRYIQSDFGRIPLGGYRLYISSKDQAAIIKYRFK